MNLRTVVFATSTGVVSVMMATASAVPVNMSKPFDAHHAVSGSHCSLARGTICVGDDPWCQTDSLQAAIDAAPDGQDDHTTIYIANDQSYTGQHLSIVNRNVTLRGGYDSCKTTWYSGTTTLSGTSTASVISISADDSHTVNLENLTIRDGGGNPSAFHAFSVGGGLTISGDVLVNVIDSEISNNSATFGGGIFIGQSIGSSLILNNTNITSNSAENGTINNAAHTSGQGGGIFCADDSHAGAGTHIKMLGGSISGNVAVADTNGTSKGGGVYLEATCYFEGHAGAQGTGVFLNIASGAGAAGGGFYGGYYIALAGTGVGAFPLKGNIAGGDGGGIWTLTDVVLDSVAVEGNVAGFSGAGSGGGIYAKGIYTSLHPLWPSTFKGNSATITGDAIALAPVANNALWLRLNRTLITENGGSTSGVIIDVVDGNVPRVWVFLVNSIVTGNNGSALIRAPNEAAYFAIVGSTIADNNIDVMFSGDPPWDPFNLGVLNLYASIFREAPWTPVTEDPFNTTVSCLSVQSGAGLGEWSQEWAQVEDEPGFVDALAGDYHLIAGSGAIDFCDETHAGFGATTAYDFVGHARGSDAPFVVRNSLNATYDLGAYEWQPPADRIFASGFGG